MPTDIRTAAMHTPPPASVTLAGSLQAELGCPGDWQPDCAVTGLAYDGDDDVWQQTLTIPAGSWEYKAALNGTWVENYGLNATSNGPNIPLDLAAVTDVKFYYDHGTHWVTDDQRSVIATVPGSFQDELGCPGDWQPDCLRSWLQDPDGDGIYNFSTNQIPPGNYEAKVTHGESWDENYGAGGVPGGDNIPFTVPAESSVQFEYDPTTHVLTISTAADLLVLTVDAGTVTAAEGSTATNSGTVSGPEGEVIALSVSSGSIVNNMDGTWSWSLPVGDGPAESQTGITVTAETATGSITDVTFDLAVDNVAPTVDLGPSMSARPDELVEIVATWTDPAAEMDQPYAWAWDTDDDGIADVEGTATYGETILLTISFPTVGTYPLVLTVTDKDGGADSAEVTVDVGNEPPVCSEATPSMDSLWPANHKMVSVEIFGVYDPDGDAVSLVVDSIWQDEPVNGTGDGNHGPDGAGVGTSSMDLRAERDGGGNGRVYHIAFTAEDGYGGMCSGDVAVTVPKSQGPNGTAVDGGPLYDATEAAL
ncbi:MAG: PKD domain-containing protein [Deferrisomatales bacterium]|nr:PKD domain-containing protein [Deferrisomatales bacterium]